MKVDHNAGFYGQKPLFGAFVRKQGNLSKSAENGEENGFYKEGRIGKMLKAGTAQSIISVSTHKNLSRFGGRFQFLGQDFFDDKFSKFGFAIYFKLGYACAKDGDQNGRIQI